MEYSVCAGAARDTAHAACLSPRDGGAVRVGYHRCIAWVRRAQGVVCVAVQTHTSNLKNPFKKLKIDKFCTNPKLNYLKDFPFKKRNCILQWAALMAFRRNEVPVDVIGQVVRFEPARHLNSKIACSEEDYQQASSGQTLGAVSCTDVYLQLDCD